MKHGWNIKPKWHYFWKLADATKFIAWKAG
jgi:hypothetical protein